MEWHTFPEGEEPEVFTSVSQECQAGECARCPGVFFTDQAGDKPVFCVHWCHREPEGGAENA
jgi:hypothetical protein